MLEEAWAPEYTYIGIIVDMDGIRKLQVRKFYSTPRSYTYDLQLELTLDEIKWAIVATKKLKIKHDVGVCSPCCFRLLSLCSGSR